MMGCMMTVLSNDSAYLMMMMMMMMMMMFRLYSAVFHAIVACLPRSKKINKDSKNKRKTIKNLKKKTERLRCHVHGSFNVTSYLPFL
jgi:hypothetical protein